MAKDKIAKAFLAITKDKFTIDTIAEMIATKHLAEGDVVRLNGYYSAGDGANHIRKISKTNDGSGVQLANGLWANIVYSGEVNVSWFGAKGDGVTDDTVAIQKSIDFGLNVILDNKIYVANGLSITKVGAKLSANGGMPTTNTTKKSTLLNKSDSDYTITLDGTNTPAYRSGQVLEGIVLKSLNSSNKGLYIKNNAEYDLSRVAIKGFDKGIVFFSSLIGTHEKIILDGNKIAMYWEVGGFSGMNNMAFRDCRFYHNNKVFTQSDFNEQFGHGVIFDNCEIESNGTGFTEPCMEFSLGSSTSDTYGIKFVNCWIEGNSNSVNMKINAIGNTTSTVILDDNVMFGQTCRSVEITGTNKDVKLVAKNTSNYSGISSDSLKITNGSRNVLMNCIFSSITLSNGSSINDIGKVDTEGRATFKNGISVYDDIGGDLFSIKKRSTNPNSVEFTTPADFYFNCSNFYINGVPKSGLIALDTPYHASQMSSLGILDSYHTYLTELHEYEKSQNVPEGVMNLNVVQPPVTPKEIEEYAKEYNLG